MTLTLEQLIYEKLVEYKAKEAGYSMTEEILAEARNEFDNMVTSVAAEMISTELNEPKKDGDYGKEAQDYLDNQLEAMGMTRDNYIHMMADDIMVHKFMDDLLKDIHAKEDELKDYYDLQLKMQKEDESAFVFEERVELYKPIEARVKHVLIALPQDQTQQYNNLMNEGKEIEAKDYLAEKLQAIAGKAQEVLDKAKRGENFENLIEVYGEDIGMKENEEGYIVRQDGQFDLTFEDAALKLKEGEISDLVATSFGYHVIKAYEKTPDNNRYTFEEKKEEIKSFVELQMKNKEWERLIDEWMSIAKIKRNPDLL